jgi:hypothetical protein
MGLGVFGGQSEEDEQLDSMDLEVAEGTKELFQIASVSPKTLQCTLLSERTQVFIT